MTTQNLSLDQISAGLDELIGGLENAAQPAEKPQRSADNPQQPEENTMVAGLADALRGVLKKAPGDIEEIQKGVRERAKPAIPESEVDALTRTPRPEVPAGRTNIPGPEGRNISFENLNTTDDINSLMDTVSKQHEDFLGARRGVVSHEQTIKEAGGYTLKDLLGRKPSDAFNAAQITAARRILVESGHKLQKAADFIANGRRDANGNLIVASDADRLAFRQLAAQHAAIQMQVAGMTAEAGRALNAFRIPADGGFINSRELTDALEVSGGPAAADKLARLVVDAGDDMSKLSKVTREASFATSSDMLLEYWINGLLSGPQTHMANISGNLMVQALKIPERLVAAGYSKLMRSPEGYKAGEAAALAIGQVRWFRKALAAGAKALKTGEPADALTKLEARKYNAITAQNVSEAFAGGLPGKAMLRAGLDPDALRLAGPWAKGVDLLGSAIRLPGRFLTSEDEFFKAWSYGSELEAEAFRRASSEGLDGEAFAKRYLQILKEPPADIHERAIAQGRYDTFTKELDKPGKAFQSLANSHPLAKMVLPFIRTPTNILKYVGERTPLAPFSKNIRADIMSGDPLRRDMALSRMTVGSLIVGSVAMAALEGNISGKGPDTSDRGVKDALRRKGWQPYSVKVGDKWYSYQRSDPLGMLLGMTADMVDVIRYGGSEDDVDSVIPGLAMSVAENLTSKTYLRGVSDLFSTITSGSEKKWERYLNRFGATFMPATSLESSVTREMDPVMREAWNLADTIRSRTPGLSQDLPPRRNLWGEPIILGGSLGWDFISPVYSSAEKYSPADNEIIDNRMDIRLPSHKLGTGTYAVELTARQYSRYVELAGATGYPETDGLTLKQYLEGVVMKEPAYQEAKPGPDGMRTEIFRHTVNVFRDLAKRKLLEEFPSIQEELDIQTSKKVTNKLPQGQTFDINTFQ